MAVVAATISYTAEPSIDFTLVPAFKDAEQTGGMIMADGQMRPIDEVERSLGHDRQGSLEVTGYISDPLSEDEVSEALSALAVDIARAWVTDTEWPEDETIADIVVKGDESHRKLYAQVAYGDPENWTDPVRVSNQGVPGEFDPGWGDFGGKIEATVSNVSVDYDS